LAPSSWAACKTCSGHTGSTAAASPVSSSIILVAASQNKSQGKFNPCTSKILISLGKLRNPDKTKQQKIPQMARKLLVRTYTQSCNLKAKSSTPNGPRNPNF
jgi:hypothetical protein